MKTKIKMFTYGNEFNFKEIETEIEQFCEDKTVKSIDVKPCVNKLLVVVVWDEDCK